jgi:hypothetical protein
MSVKWQPTVPAVTEWCTNLGAWTAKITLSTEFAKDVYEIYVTCSSGRSIDFNAEASSEEEAKEVAAKALKALAEAF